MPIYEVITVEMIKNVYLIEAKEEGHAKDVVTMKEALLSDGVEYLDEVIISVSETNEFAGDLVYRIEYEKE